MKSPATSSNLFKMFALGAVVGSGLMMAPALTAAPPHVLKVSGDEGQIGILGDGYVNASSTPIAVTLPAKVTQVAEGNKFTLYLLEDGSVYGLGLNFFGQLGTGDNKNVVLPTKISIPDGKKIKAVACGRYHSLFLAVDGTVYSTGFNGRGQLGLDLPIPQNTADVNTVHQISFDTSAKGKVAQIAAGDFHSVMLTESGDVYSFGSNASGQLGTDKKNEELNIYKDQATPVILDSGVAQIGAGGNTTVYLKDTVLWGVGLNSSGQLGLSGGGFMTTKTQLQTDVTAFAMGRIHLAVIKKDGKFYSVGDNTSGQLGAGGTGGSRYTWTATDVNTAVTTTSTDSAGNTTSKDTVTTHTPKAVYATSRQTFIVDSNGEVLATGQNAYGELGSPDSYTNPSTYWVTFAKGKTIGTVAETAKFSHVNVAAGDTHLTFVDSAGAAWSLGSGDLGQHADGKPQNHPLPMTVTGSAIAMGGTGITFSYVDGNGGLHSVGYNYNGLLANGVLSGTSPGNSNVFVGSTVTEMQSDIESISIGESVAAAVRTDGSLWVWGSNTYGQLGIQTRTDLSYYSRPFKLTDDVKKVVMGASGNGYILAVKKSTGALFGGGANQYGQLGFKSHYVTSTTTTNSDGTTTKVDTDHYDTNNLGYITMAQSWPMAGITGADARVADVATGANFTAIVTEAGNLYTMGYNASGQLGDGTSVSTTVDGGVTTFKTPTVIATNVRSVACSNSSLYYVTNDNDLYGVGDTSYGQFGIVTKKPVTTPVKIASNVLKVTAASSYVAYTKLDHSLVARGSNASGQLGTGGTESGAFPDERKIRDYVFDAVAAGSYLMTLEDETPTITASSSNQVLADGASTTLSVTATGSGLTYQWYKDNVALSGATGSTYTISSYDSSKAGLYRVVVSSGTSSVESYIYVSGTPSGGATDSVFTNFSVRATAGSTDASALLVGIVPTGEKQFLFRAIGPSLSQFGLTGLLEDPNIEIFKQSGTTAVASNDNWGTTNADTLIAKFNQVGAFGLLSTDSKDAAVSYSLTGEPYNVKVTSKLTDKSGIVLAEGYDLAPQATGSSVKNFSVRTDASSGAKALILGFVVSGEKPKRVLVRAIGPGLLQFGVTGTLADPYLEVHTTVNGNDVIVAANDDWVTEYGAAAAFQQAGAFTLSSSTGDSALVLSLKPGAYTLVVKPSDNEAVTGNALAEVYSLPDSN